ncbi:tetratricopeptide repeat protein [Marinobacter lacisalsi]|uniref:Tetratricopeptide repeat protein n=1 Tax=Marinobacter lacisalsi TaxID=475979 RepID=A0ABV8QMS5_9GAMM
MKWMILLVASLLVQPVWADTLETDLAAIQQRWAEIQYQVAEDDKEKAFEVLAGDAEELTASYPGRAEPLIWRAIVLSTWAGEKGGLGALGLVKEARQHLEKAIEIDDQALDGSAYTSLGSLYYQVPGWPIGFGDDDKARRYLQKALAINPDGIDPNFFFADYLIEQGEEERARQYLERALSAPDRPGRSLADEGRRQEVRDRRAKLATSR